MKVYESPDLMDTGDNFRPSEKVARRIVMSGYNFDHGDLFICVEFVTSFFCIPPGVRNIRFELHDKSVPESYEMKLDELVYYVGGSVQLTTIGVGELILDPIFKKHKKLYLKCTYVD